jgi:hypothetical protein
LGFDIRSIHGTVLTVGHLSSESGDRKNRWVFGEAEIKQLAAFMKMAR